uniref:Uncharacterized protein n=1 Tax=Denticeps clupeoides TaxID=299321 RepID=A0AAY4AHQ1_9TELE
VNGHENKENTTDDQNGWETFLRKSKFCHRPTQSFLPDSERERVNAVCASGGKLYKGNLCISKEPFSFITVRVEQGTSPPHPLCIGLQGAEAEPS